MKENKAMKKKKITRGMVHRVFEMHLDEGLSGPEIAGRVGLSETAVRRLLKGERGTPSDGPDWYRPLRTGPVNKDEMRAIVAALRERSDEPDESIAFEMRRSAALIRQIRNSISSGENRNLAGTTYALLLDVLTEPKRKANVQSTALVEQQKKMSTPTTAVALAPMPAPVSRSFAVTVDGVRYEFETVEEARAFFGRGKR